MKGAKGWEDADDQYTAQIAAEHPMVGGDGRDQSGRYARYRMDADRETRSTTMKTERERRRK